MAGAPGSMGKLMRFSFAPTGRGSPEVIGGRFKPTSMVWEKNLCMVVHIGIER